MPFSGRSVLGPAQKGEHPNSSQIEWRFVGTRKFTREIKQAVISALVFLTNMNMNKFHRTKFLAVNFLGFRSLSSHSSNLNKNEAELFKDEFTLENFYD